MPRIPLPSGLLVPLKYKKPRKLRFALADCTHTIRTIRRQKRFTRKLIVLLRSAWFKRAGRELTEERSEYLMNTGNLVFRCTSETKVSPLTLFKNIKHEPGQEPILVFKRSGELVILKLDTFIEILKKKEFNDVALTTDNNHP
jgi:hypothetical protein